MRPLAGIKVIEFTHMVMGPTVGLILGDLGADVIKVEPVGGDPTRRLKGSGAGYFPMYNRNKRSLAVDLKSPDGVRVVQQLAEKADVFVENFRTGTAGRLGLGYKELSAINPGLIYCSEKGFLSGPYENRTALDEVAQMMGGLAYMTGPPGRPLRAGSSIVDITGGMFGAIGVLAALKERAQTGKGTEVVSSLFETTAFVVGQHMAQAAVTGAPAPPMPARVSAWAIYDLFDTSDDKQIFIGVVSDKQWQLFMSEFKFPEFEDGANFETNAQRVEARDQILPVIARFCARHTLGELETRLEACGLPFAPVARPEDLFDNPHLNAHGGLIETYLPDQDKTTKLPSLPIQMNGERVSAQLQPPAAGAHSHEILSELGYAVEDIDQLSQNKVISCATAKT